MTIKLPTRWEQKAIEDGIRDPEGAAVFFELDVEGIEYGDLIYDGHWGSDSSGSIYTDFSVGARLDTSDDTPSSFAISVNGIAAPQMAGLTTLPNIGGTDAGSTASTEFFAVSARAIANGLTLNQLTRFPGIMPKEVVRDAARLAPYAKQYTRIDPLEEPLLYFQEPDAHFWPNEYVGDILKRVEEQTPLRIRDNAWGGLTATLELESTQVEDYRHYNASDFPIERAWRPPPRTERRYSRVVVYKRNPDGTDAFEPQIAKVDYRGENPPLENEWKWIVLDEGSEQASLRALNLARKTARKIGRAQRADSGLILPFFDPLIEIQDPFLVSERWEDVGGIYDRKWMGWVDSYKHYRKPLKTEVSYSAALVEKDRLEIPALAMAGISGGVMKTLFGSCDYIGDLVRLDTTELDWVEENGDLITVGEDAPAVDINGDLVSVTCEAEYIAPFYGEVHPNLIRFDDINWAQESGDLVVIDSSASEGHAVESGDLITIS